MGVIPTAASRNNVEANTSGAAEVLVKDIPDLPKLSDKPYLRGASKINYGEMLFGGNVNTNKNTRAIGFEDGSGSHILETIIGDYKGTGFTNRANAFQKDAQTRKIFTQNNTLSVISNPSAGQAEAFNLSNIDDIARNNLLTVYTFDLKSHIKIPNEFVNKNGKFLFASNDGPIMLYYGNSAGSGGKRKDKNAICYQMINGDLLSGDKGTYSVKKGNIVDYTLACYFAGNVKPNTMQDIRQVKDMIPKSWEVYSVPDTSAKDIGKKYTVTNRDMFLYENEVHSAK